MSSEDRVTQIRIGKFAIGIIGLDAALSEVVAANLPADAAAARAILDRLQKSNYVAPGAESEYLEALLREYRKHLGQPVREPPPEGVDVKVLGPGCPNCERLEQLVREVMAAERIAGSLDHVRDVNEIKNYRIFMTPGLVINGRVRCAGRVPSERELLEWLRAAGKEARTASADQH